MVVQDPCSVCNKCVRGNDRAVYCNVCKLWVHIKCNYITPPKYEELKQESEKTHFHCINCIKKETPFGFESDETFRQTNTLGCNTDSNLENLNFSLNKDEKKAIKQI